jgi:hypothetical protein
VSTDSAATCLRALDRAAGRRERGAKSTQPWRCALPSLHNCHLGRVVFIFVAAGLEAALIKRVGNDVLGVGPQPQIVGNDLKSLDDLHVIASRLITRHKGQI